VTTSQPPDRNPAPEPDSAKTHPVVSRLRAYWGRLREHSDKRPRSWLSVSRDLARWALLAVPIGIVAGLGSATFYFVWLEATKFFLVAIVGIGYPYAGPPASGIVIWSSSFPRILLLPVVLLAGGVGTGFIVQYLSPEVAGHGTDETIKAFHQKGGEVRLRVPLLKILAGALTLGTGGSGGREGPSAQIGGGFGSWWAGILKLGPRERRIALAAGLGAGVGAIFRAPLGGAIYAAEIFYTQDFEPEVFFPAIVASVISYSIFGIFFGFSTLFALPIRGVSWSVDQIALYAFLGLACAGVGVAFVRVYSGIARWFNQTSWTPLVRIVIGMVITGALILAVYFLVPWGNHFASLAALNVGYGFVQAAMLGQIGLVPLAPLALLALIIAVGLRMVTTGFTVGSGGAAGLFGTSVVIGALIGTSIGAVFHSLAPTVVSLADISAFAVVGMMTFFGGISKAPLAVLVMVVEMTGSYTLLVPAMLSIFIAYIATGPNHLYTEQFRTRLDSPAHRDEYTEYLLGSRPPEPTSPG
jgi:CIC family chloride channel protein